MDKVYSIWFAQLQLPYLVKKRLFDAFKSYKDIFSAQEDELDMHLKEKLYYNKMQQAKQNLKQCAHINELCKEQKIQIIDQMDEIYPTLLREIPNSPWTLFVKGNISCMQTPCIAIVGARKCSEYGYEVAKKIGEQLSNRGITVVSGLALGIDEAAHKGALKNGNTIAILGTGIDICYPKQNSRLYDQISYEGLIISEYAPGVPGLCHHFPQRNRIISGMCLGVVVVEAAKKSGSLITADFALEQNREVFAVPGNITSKLSEGTNILIQQGAKLIISIEDILEELPTKICCQTNEKKQIKNTKETKVKLAHPERMVYAYVDYTPTDLQNIMMKTQLPYEIVYTQLIALEIKKYIKRLPGERYMRL